MKRTFKAVMSGIAYAANFWWAGVVYMVTGIDITDPAEESRAD
jgi:hypothetical protein